MQVFRQFYRNIFLCGITRVDAVLPAVRWGVELEKPELNRPFCEGGMVVEHVMFSST